MTPGLATGRIGLAPGCGAGGSDRVGEMNGSPDLSPTRSNGIERGSHDGWKAKQGWWCRKSSLYSQRAVALGLGNEVGQR